VHSTRNCKW